MIQYECPDCGTTLEASPYRQTCPDCGSALENSRSTPRA
ncbi:MAG: rubrerythrin-like domain-containing protein [Haloferacaceae archaeon]